MWSSAYTGNNRIVGYSYDAARNLLNDGAYTYGYNAESEIKSAAGVNYTYDGDGNRIEKSSGKIYWYGAGTEILDESDTSGNFTNEYVFFGGKRIAMRNVSSGTIYYYEDDMLGSARTMVQAGQTSVCYDGDFYPFGGERIITNTCTQNYKFEGKERDTETGNDDFGARYYSSRLGRWLSADWSSVPATVPYANLTNPQTLNLYAMVSDNPETFADLDGHCSMDEEVCDTGPTIGGPTDPASANKDVCNSETGKCDQKNTNVNGNVQDQAQQQLSWSSLSAGQQALVSGGAKAWGKMSVDAQANFDAITNVLGKEGLLSDVQSASMRADAREMNVVWKAGAEKAFEKAGYHVVSDPMHNGTSMHQAGNTVEGMHAVFPSSLGNESQAHIDYRSGPAHFGTRNDDVLYNEEEYKKWYGPLPGLIP